MVILNYIYTLAVSSAVAIVLALLDMNIQVQILEDLLGGGVTTGLEVIVVPFAGFILAFALFSLLIFLLMTKFYRLQGDLDFMILCYLILVGLAFGITQLSRQWTPGIFGIFALPLFQVYGYKFFMNRRRRKN